MAEDKTVTVDGEVRPEGSEAASKPGNVQGKYVYPTRKLLKHKQAIEAQITSDTRMYGMNLGSVIVQSGKKKTTDVSCKPADSILGL